MHKLALNEDSDYSLNARSVDGINQRGARKKNNSVDKNYRLPHINKRWDDSEAYFDLSQLNSMNKGRKN